MAFTMKDFWKIMAMVAVALAVLWTANNIQEIGRLVAPRGQV